MSAADSGILQLYQRARLRQAAGAITVLRLGADQCAFASGSGAAPEALLTVALGSRRSAELFRHVPPTAYEMEEAIMVVEDALAPLRAQLLADATLYCDDALVHEVARHAGIVGGGSEEVWLPTTQLEFTFGRFAEVVQGRPARTEGLPLDGEFAATLLIVRELTHHLGFDGLYLLPPR
ncbi:hypothetical protein [Vogesella sp. LIG4]|uniref:hypothetical protein n=1 Tax=Vogesella sp. LIG4 TaxID=1192162 RepID=UPI00081FD9D5|nr:hypothetical protein [Vogesella sp. LIG4]SCK06943.1 hypothetical protein PSELUDRAFT_0313 [Vogesella sp. LIG4]